MNVAGGVKKPTATRIGSHHPAVILLGIMTCACLAIDIRLAYASSLYHGGEKYELFWIFLFALPSLPMQLLSALYLHKRRAALRVKIFFWSAFFLSGAAAVTGFVI